MKCNWIIIIVLALLFASPGLSAAFDDSSRIDILFEDFEADDGGFVGSSDWEWGEFNWVGSSCDSDNFPPPDAYSGTKLWATRVNDCYSNLGNNTGYADCINTNLTDDSTLTFTVDLTGYSDATLSFYEWFDLFIPWDWAEVYANGTVVFQHCGGAFVEPIDWALQLIDLTPYAGGTVIIEFHMMSSTVINHAGWYIDDVSVFTSGGSPTATPTIQPTATPTSSPQTPTPTPDDCLQTGDVNQDSDITAGDAQMAFLITLGVIMPTQVQACAADCNGDGEVTAGDAQTIFLTVLGTAACVDPLM